MWCFAETTKEQTHHSGSTSDQIHNTEKGLNNFTIRLKILFKHIFFSQNKSVQNQLVMIYISTANVIFIQLNTLTIADSHIREIVQNATSLSDGSTEEIKCKKETHHSQCNIYLLVSGSQDYFDTVHPYSSQGRIQVIQGPRQNQAGGPLN